MSTATTLEIALIIVLPLCNLMFLFIKDSNKKRRYVTNILICLNILLYLAPYLSGIPNTPSGKSVLWEGQGDGGVFMYYFLIFPLCLVTTIILAVLRFKARKEAKK
ncbi:MAG: hypothetical protein NXI10_17835 [bacterium]|nr:hypothetical protein [bacterium]